MKKIILTLLIFFTLVNAQLSDKQLEHYLEVSGEANAYRDRSGTPVYFLRNLDMEPGEFPAIDKLTRDIMNDFKLKNIYVNTFRDMPEDLYNNIIKFYQTDIGKKYASRSRFAVYRHERNIFKLHERYKIALKKGTISKKNSLMIKKILDAFNDAGHIKKRLKRYYLETNKIWGNRIDQKNIDDSLSKYHDYLIQLNFQNFSFQLANFTFENLEELYEYAKTGAAKLERKLLFNASDNWNLALAKIAFDHKSKISKMEFCYIMSKDMANKPSLCKPEWLSKEVQESIDRNNKNDQNTTDNNTTQ